MSINNNYSALFNITSDNSYGLDSGLYMKTFSNEHSHAFQYLGAGAGELFNLQESDDFWSWRRSMYSLAKTLDPDSVFTCARLLYYKMLEKGYHHTVEFHYLHNDIEGATYDDREVMGKAIIEAAKQTGMNLTLCPVYYKTGGFGKPPSENQKRFLFQSPDDYLTMLSNLEKFTKEEESIDIACGVHSLRACSGEDLRYIYENTSAPFHIHISEQTKEVEDCLAFSGKRPIELLYEILGPLGIHHERLQLVHATHINAREIHLIAQALSKVILCPTTEANLGDGVFPLADFLKNGGIFGIGSDSHVGLCPLTEIRLLDWTQRLTHRKRSASLPVPSHPSRFETENRDPRTPENKEMDRKKSHADNKDVEIGSFLTQHLRKQPFIYPSAKKYGLIKLNEDHPLIFSRQMETVASTLTTCFESSMIEGIYDAKGNRLSSPEKYKKYLQAYKKIKLRY